MIVIVEINAVIMRAIQIIIIWAYLIVVKWRGWPIIAIIWVWIAYNRWWRWGWGRWRRGRIIIVEIWWWGERKVIVRIVCGAVCLRWVFKLWIFFESFFNKKKKFIYFFKKSQVVNSKKHSFFWICYVNK